MESKEIEVFLSGKYDNVSAVLSIYAGAGGQDAQDWATMLLRMYLRYADRKGFAVKILHQSFGDVGPEGRIGTKSVTVEIKGSLAYGLLKRENGVHRLVRISPFSAQSLRHTSFAMVEVMPEISKADEEEIKINASIKERKVIDRYETVRVKKDGSIVDVSLTVSPILNELNQVIGASKIMRDISAQKVSEYEKAQMMNDLIQRNKDLEQFAYIVSHNLRAPVANIIGVTNFMKMPDIQPEENSQMVSALNKSVVALDNVIKDLSLILQIRREINEQKALIQFSEIMDEIQLAIENLIQKERVEFVLDFSEIDEINSIKSYIYSIFYNLISNSIKYKQLDVQPTIKIKSYLIDKQIVLVFKDNGLGIDLKKNKDTVFGLYKRFHSHTEAKGMGLFMVKTQIETLGEKISIRSETNRGTEFKIELPQETIR